MITRPEEIELQRLTTEQSEIEDQVVNAEDAIESLKTETLRFQRRYYQTVGVLYAEIDSITAKIARIKAGESPENIQLEAEALAAEAQAKKSSSEAGITEPESAPPPEITPELKATYRQAARLIHPDRATTDQERIRRNELMSRVNLAYEKGDQISIEKIIEEFGVDPESITGDDVGSQIVKCIRRISQLRRRLSEIEESIQAIKRSEEYQLKTTVESAESLGGNPLESLSQKLLEEISELKIELETLNH